jgi:hypothetical protein
MKRLDYWKAKLKVAQAEKRQRSKEYSQIAAAFDRAVGKVKQIEEKVEHEKTKLARAE